MEGKCPSSYVKFYVAGVGFYRWNGTSTATPDTSDSPQSIVQCTGVVTGRMVLDTGGVVMRRFATSGPSASGRPRVGTMMLAFT